MENYNETIFAPSSGSIPAGVNIIRISGPASQNILKGLIKGKMPPPRIMSLQKIYMVSPIDDNNLIIDEAMVVWFKAPHSFTGEDMVELHLHGSIAIQAKIFESLLKFEGVRFAENGEFTRRAFQNGKIDLLEVEGLADLIQARTESQRVQALRQAEGQLSKLCQQWSSQIISLLSFVEAQIDFSEDDLPPDLDKKLMENIHRLNQEINLFIKGFHSQQLIRDGIEIAIIGAPNVGKSSFLNWMTNENSAIVSDIPGTTRDLIRVNLNMGGSLVTLTDTAGLRDNPQDEIERQGIERAIKEASHADFILILKEIDKPSAYEDNITHHLIQTNKKYLTIYNKLDLQSVSPPPSANDFYISLKSGAGLEKLKAHLNKEIHEMSGFQETIGFTRERHLAILNEISLELFELENSNLFDYGLKAEYLRRTLTLIGRLVGKIDIETMLDNLFKEFCIGK